jgi:hypothetical protein
MTLGTVLQHDRPEPVTLGTSNKVLALNDVQGSEQDSVYLLSLCV